MTIEINRAGSNYIYRVNPYNNREIDRRLNRRGARWMHHDRYTNEAEARQELLKLERDAKK